MLVREEPDGEILAIAQPAHAALAGRLAEVWDDELPAGLLLAAAHHDDVWLERDAAPPLNPATGRPETFLELSDADRHAVWSRAAEVAAPLGPDAELWVLRHAERLHERLDAPALKAMTAAFGDRIAELRGDRDDASLARGTSLLALLDVLSLSLCFGVREPRDAGVLRLAPVDGGAVAVAPWPFRGARVATWVEVRRLPDGLDDQAALDAGWPAAEPFDLAVTLVPQG